MDWRKIPITELIDLLCTHCASNLSIAISFKQEPLELCDTCKQKTKEWIKKMKIKKFYFVMSPDGKGIKFTAVEKFKTEDDAIAFAEALSKEHPSETYYIVESQAQVRAETCAWHV